MRRASQDRADLMRIVYEYSHFGGSEILQVRYPDTLADIQDVIRTVAPTRSKASREKIMQGRSLYAPKDIDFQFKAGLRRHGFHEAIDSHAITIPQRDVTIDGVYKQIDLVKDSVYVKVQFGKHDSMFCDMAKFQYFYNDGKAEVGVEIVPTHSLHRQMSSGVSYGEQLVDDIERLKRHFPAVPVMVVLVDV